jgi:hypothetical protein
MCMNTVKFNTEIGMLHQLHSLKYTKRHITERLSHVSTVIIIFFITCKNLPTIPDDLDTNFLYVFPMSMLTGFTMESQ